MRWLFLFVLFLNLLYVGWQLMQPPEKMYADVAPLKDVTAIVLLSERVLPVKSVIIAEEAVVDEESFVVASTDEHEESIVEVAAASKSENIKAAQPSDASIVKLGAVKESVATEKEAGTKSKAPEVVSKQGLENQVANRCFSMGPFRNVEVLSRLTQDIKPYVASTSFRSVEKKEAKVYWVYIKPEKNRQAAIKTGNRLKAKKIKDFYVIREGEKLNGLSLGHFRNKKGAYSLTRKIKNLGFNVLVEPVQKKYSHYWLDYQLAKPKVDVPAVIVKKYLKVNKKDKVARVSRNCAG